MAHVGHLQGPIERRARRAGGSARENGVAGMKIGFSCAMTPSANKLRYFLRVLTPMLAMSASTLRGPPCPKAYMHEARSELVAERVGESFTKLAFLKRAEPARSW